MSKQFRKKADKNAKKIGEFLGVKPPKFEIGIAGSREEFNHLVKKSSTPRWMVGMYLKEKFSTVVLLHPKVVVNEGVHSREHMELVLIHEVAHLVFEQIYPFPEPLWLKEGIAVYLSGQCPVSGFDLEAFFQKGNFPVSLTTQKQWEKLRRFGAYGIAGKFIEFLIREFGEKSFKLWIQNLPKSRFTQKEFLMQFERFYKDSLTLTGKIFLNSLKGRR